MKQLGKTSLHRLVESLPRDAWTEESQRQAEHYLEGRAFGLRLRDVAHEVGIRTRIDRYFPPDQLFEHRPSKVLAAFDRLRQNELDYNQARRSKEVDA